MLKWSFFFFFFFLFVIDVPMSARGTLSPDFDKELLYSGCKMPSLKSCTCAQMFTHTVHTRYDGQKTQNHKKETAFLFGNPALIFSLFFFLVSKCNENTGSIQHNSLILEPNVLSTVRASSPLYKNES